MKGGNRENADRAGRRLKQYQISRFRQGTECRSAEIIGRKNKKLPGVGMLQNGGPEIATSFFHKICSREMYGFPFH